MKNLSKKSVLMLGLLVSMFTFANSEVTPIKKKEVTIMSFKKVKLGSKLSIKDRDGIVLYEESIVQTGDFSKGFDLTTLPNGDYYFELDSELEIVIIPFNVVSNQVVFKKDEKTKIFKPLVRIKDNLVFVSGVSHVEFPIEFKIFYAENYDLILSEKSDSQAGLKKIYDFSKAKKGNYLFVFKSNGREFRKTIKI